MKFVFEGEKDCVRKTDAQNLLSLMDIQMNEFRTSADFVPQNSAEVQKGETREDIAKIAGVSNNLSVWSKFPLPFRS